MEPFRTMQQVDVHSRTRPIMVSRRDIEVIDSIRTQRIMEADR